MIAVVTIITRPFFVLAAAMMIRRRGATFVFAAMFVAAALRRTAIGNRFIF